MNCESEVCNEVECIKKDNKDYIASPGTLLDLSMLQRQQQIKNTNRLNTIERKIDHIIDQLNRIESRQRGIRVD